MSLTAAASLRGSGPRDRPLSSRRQRQSARGSAIAVMIAVIVVSRQVDPAMLRGKGRGTDVYSGDGDGRNDVGTTPGSPHRRARGRNDVRARLHERPFQIRKDVNAEQDDPDGRRRTVH